MVGLYFSGTGNTRYVTTRFCEQYEAGTQVFSIEDENAIEAVKNADLIVFAYPVQYSTVPKMVRDYIKEHGELWAGKSVFAIATMG